MIEWVERAMQYEGDIAEIGLGIGETTIQLLEVADKCDRMVYGVDPFESGWHEMPESYGRPYKQMIFESRIESYKDRFRHLKETSLSEAAEIFLFRPLAFAYVDGLQYKGAVLSDLRIVSYAEIIVVDDMNRKSGQSQVPQAIEEFLQHNNRKLIIHKERWAVLIK